MENKNIKIIAMYLPQYHQIEENNLWWGKGYTEWEAVKNAQPLFNGHKQPRIPLNKNYYDLSEEDAKTWSWQAEIAKSYGIYGFCIYHYWFGGGKKLLEKPIEILLSHPEININYCICWANENWTKTWYGLDQEILMEQKYGELKEWIQHFEYLLPFFKDQRYIKIQNRPVINLHRSSHIKELGEMLNCWNKMAKKNGFDGVYIIAANTGGEIEYRYNLVDAYYNFEPGFTLNHKTNIFERLIYGASIWIKMQYNRFFKNKIIERVIDINKIYRRMIRDSIKLKKPVYKGLFPMWDNTPRRGYKGLYYKKYSPELFYKALKEIIKSSDQNSFIFINAWNEWGEGCYLEPDEEHGYGYLEAIKKSLDNS